MIPDPELSPGSHSVETGREPVRHTLTAEGDPVWMVNPYQGCELGCVFCPVRIDEPNFQSWRQFDGRVGINAHAIKSFVREVAQSRRLGCRVILGTRTEPWQQAEERFRLTRSVLEALASLDRVDLCATTRSSLIARDGDLLRQIAARGNVRITFALACLDDRISRLLEPRGPSALRRLAAMEALASAGVPVGLLVSPIFAGLDEDEIGLESLLTRAAHAGARFAGMSWMHFGLGQRKNFLSHATAAQPESAARLRRIIGRPSPSEAKARLEFAFSAHCRRLGLLPLDPMEASLSRSGSQAATQLPLFAGQVH